MTVQCESIVARAVVTSHKLPLFSFLTCRKTSNSPPSQSLLSRVKCELTGEEVKIKHANNKERSGAPAAPGRPAGFRLWSGRPGPLLVALLPPGPETQGQNAGTAFSSDLLLTRGCFLCQTDQKEGRPARHSFFF